MTRLVKIGKAVLAEDERIAQAIRREMASRGIFVINLIGSPGAGKTSLLEATLQRLDLRCAVVEGDIATARDAARIDALGVPVVQITTKGACHLEAHLVRKALDALPLDDVDLLFIENVGNLVCPADFDLGEDAKIAVASVTEGEDKPLKYPGLFSQARVIVLTKIDLLPHVPFSRDFFREDVRRLNATAQIYEVAALRGEGLDVWIEALCSMVAEKRERCRVGSPA